MQLYFIRHGQSINNANVGNPEYRENPDPYLTQIGLEQAELLANYLKKSQPITDDRSWNNQNQLGAFHLSYEVVTQPKVTGCVWNGEL
jgi:hypothetical protein